MKIPDGPWKVYVLPKDPPNCPTHGPMKLNFAADRYDCVGFDGEGCEYKVRCDDYLVEIGTTEPGEFEV